MKATLLSIGDELLIGQTLNTNVQWISQQLIEYGIDVEHHVTLSDNRDDIIQCLNSALSTSTFVFITGGLGPTSDDITKDVLCEYFEGKLIYHEPSFENIASIYRLRNRQVTEAAKQMAYVPDNCVVIPNTLGTAPGMLFHKDDKVVVSMPGVPYEMKAMVKDTVLPYIKSKYTLPVIIHFNILTAGTGETVLAECLKEFEATKDYRIKLAYLPNVGKVRLRLTVKGEDRHELNELMEEAKAKVIEAVQEYIVGFNEETLETNIAALLVEKNLTIGTAESCTGGYIAHLLTSISGSSAYFKGSIISYSNELKSDILKVSETTLSTYGAVSEQTVQEMLSGALNVLKTDIVIAVSGIAGPLGGTNEKPVGTVYIGIANRENRIVNRYSFTNNRERNIQLSAVMALVMLRNFILKSENE